MDTFYKYEEDDIIIMSYSNWAKWFDQFGNKDIDGWTDFKSWFAEMLKMGILTRI